MKIFVWGNNYPLNNKESQEPFLSQEPYVYLKPDSAILKDCKPFFLPDFSTDLRAGVEIVLKVSRLGKSISPRFASRYYHEVTVGVNFTAWDLWRQCKEQGLPRDLAVGFDNAAALGKFIPLSDHTLAQGLQFRLEVNGKSVMQGATSAMRWTAEEGIARLSRYYTLKIGDLIYTGAPADPMPVDIGDHLEGYVGEEKLLDFYIR